MTVKSEIIQGGQAFTFGFAQIEIIFYKHRLFYIF